MAARLGGVVNSTRKMADLINQMLDVTRVQMGQLLELVRVPTDLANLVRQMVDQQGPTPAHRIELRAPAHPMIGAVDPARFERVVANLLSNAVKYSPDGGLVRLTLTSEEIEGVNWAVLTVTDSGVGIPVGDLPHVFTSFFRGSNVMGHIQGSGIGLASTRQIVEQHGGFVMATSELGRGATFTVRVPLESE